MNKFTEKYLYNPHIFIIYERKKLIIRKIVIKYRK